MALYKTKDYGFDAPLTVQHQGTPVVQRLVVGFATAVALAANDVILIGKLPADYVLENVRIDLDQTVPNAVVEVGILNDGETAVDHSVITAGSLDASGFVDGNSAEAVREGRFDKPKTIGLVVTTGGNITAGTEIGFTVTYRNAAASE
ncbi:hypothetical protein [Acinetobacter modestus]|uniref:hypothetical protein n=1 Tax=Acinetobacter modestus TaxID=1776740 RepID=UPI003015E158